MPRTNLVLAQYLSELDDVNASVEELNAALDLSAARADGNLEHIHVSQFEYEYSVAADGTVAAHSLGDDLPADAVIIGGFVDVLKTFTSADDSATIALHIAGANDLVTATAISGGSNIWDQGVHSIVPAMTGATAIKLAAAAEPQLTVAVQVITAGHLLLTLYWVKGIEDDS